LACGGIAVLQRVAISVTRRRTERGDPAVNDTAYIGASNLVAAALALDDGGALTPRESLLWQLATLDPLTGLLNRSAFINAVVASLEQASGDSSLSAMLYVDLDRFKQINDRYGDLLLRAVAQRILAAVRPDDIVGRFGGDEFCVYITTPRTSDDTTSIATRIVQTISERFTIDDELVLIDASVGVAFVTDRPTDVDQLIHLADQAMYRAKASGGACWNTLDPTGQNKHRRENGTVPNISDLVKRVTELQLLVVERRNDARCLGEEETTAQLDVICNNLECARMMMSAIC
jgi:diguanylate cyclase (GGDEF)-like protein